MKQSGKKEESIEKAIKTLKEKMKLMNFNNLQPPYFNHTLTKFRQNYLSNFLKDINLQNTNDDKKIKDGLQVVHYIFEHFEDECFQTYVQQLRGPYIRKMFQDNYEFDAVNFKQANLQYHLKSQIEETLSQAAEWLVQIQVTQDLLSRIQLYFKLKTPHIIEKIRQEGLKNEKGTWPGYFASCFRKLLSFSLRKSSKTIQSTFFTTLAPSALMLTLAIIGGNSTLPWKPDLNISTIMPALAVVTVPYILDGMAKTVEKSEVQTTLKRWALTFEALSDNIRKFNEKLEESMRNCTLSVTSNEFLKERTNLQKIVSCLDKDIASISNYDEQKFEEMRERTEAYFRPYVEIKEEDDWVVVYPKQQEQPQ